MNKPKLTDIKLVNFFTDINKNIHIKDIKPDIIKKKPIIDMFLINIIFIFIILIFIYILYKRNKYKKYNKLVYENKIKNLYNNIINY